LLVAIGARQQNNDIAGGIAATLLTGIGNSIHYSTPIVATTSYHY
jgi:hypothetical protein